MSAMNMSQREAMRWAGVQRLKRALVIFALAAMIGVFGLMTGTYPGDPSIPSDGNMVLLPT